MITVDLSTLAWLAIAQLTAVLILVAVATTLLTRGTRGVLKIQEIHITALSQRLDTEVGTLKAFIEKLKGRVETLEEYIVANGLPVPHSREDAQEFSRKIAEQKETAKALLIPPIADNVDLRARSRELRERGKGNQTQDTHRTL